MIRLGGLDIGARAFLSGPALLTVLCCAASSAAQAAGAGQDAQEVAAAERVVVPESPPTGEVRFQAVLDLNQSPPAGQPELRGGVEAASRDWPASLYATYDTVEGRKICTAALIGPQALLTAAHCMSTSLRIFLVFQGREYGAVCEQHPDYRNRRDMSADFALCRLDQPLTVSPEFRFERIDMSPMSERLGKPLALGGFGCTSDTVAEANEERENPRIYRIGSTRVDETSESPAQRRGQSFYRPFEENNLFTVEGSGVANICPGDSGGPAFRLGQGSTHPHLSRAIVGVNSRVFYLDEARTRYGSSLISATGGPDFRQWAMGWRQQAQVAACGLGGGSLNCRN